MYKRQIITEYNSALDPIRPLGIFSCDLNACPIPLVVVTVTRGAWAEFTADQKTAAETALTAFINSVRPFIASADKVSERNDTIAAFNLMTTISQAVPGAGFESATFTVDGVLLTSYIADNGAAPYLDSVTWA